MRSPPPGSCQGGSKYWISSHRTPIIPVSSSRKTFEACECKNAVSGCHWNRTNKTLANASWKEKETYIHSHKETYWALYIVTSFIRPKVVNNSNASSNIICNHAKKYDTYILYEVKHKKSKKYVCIYTLYIWKMEIHI